MRASARRDIVDDGHVGVYHFIARCVRRAFLCGTDFYSGRDYSHRKAWILDRLRHLAGLIGDPVCGYAIRKYVMLLDWTGRELRRDKHGAIPDDLAPILDRLGVDRSNWVRSGPRLRAHVHASGRSSEFACALHHPCTTSHTGRAVGHLGRRPRTTAVTQADRRLRVNKQRQRR